MHCSETRLVTTRHHAAAPASMAHCPLQLLQDCCATFQSARATDMAGASGIPAHSGKDENVGAARR
jgi:hypothetical protein